MKYAIYDYEEITSIGKESIQLLHEGILNTRVLDMYYTLLVTTDDVLSDSKIQFNREIDSDTDLHYIFWHILMFGATCMYLGSNSYIKKKKLFGGYERDISKIAFYGMALENELLKYRDDDKFCNLKVITLDDSSDIVNYSYGPSFSNSPIPYFPNNYVNKSEHDINVLAHEFAKNIAYIREPQNNINSLVAAIMYATDSILELVDFILKGFFID
jgi:hypothetical protein